MFSSNTDCVLSAVIILWLVSGSETISFSLGAISIVSGVSLASSKTSVFFFDVLVFDFVFSLAAVFSLAIIFSFSFFSFSLTALVFLSGLVFEFKASRSILPTTVTELSLSTLARITSSASSSLVKTFLFALINTFSGFFSVVGSGVISTLGSDF